MDRKQYEEDLKRRQKEHLDAIQRQEDLYWRPCMHDQCSECIGTGVKRDGTPCIHMISCPCPKCTPMCISWTGYISPETGDDTESVTTTIDGSFSLTSND